MGCWFEFKREKIFLDHILANYVWIHTNLQKGQRTLQFILNDDQFHPEILEEQKMSNFVLDFLPSNTSQDIELNLKGEY